MSQSGSWVPKESDQQARQAAREAAVSEGLTLGEYLDRLMKASEAPQPNETSSSFENRRPQGDATSDALEKLARRIEASEARSALAITGLDHTIHDLVGRLEKSQHTTVAIAGHVEGMIDQLRETHDALKAKVRRLEEDDTHQQNLEALKALESALGKLAAHVYEENGLAQQEAQAIKGRVESGFMDIIERVETMETRVESGLAAATKQAKEGAEQAELRAAGKVRHLSENFAALETRIQERFATLDRADARIGAAETRLDTVEQDVSGGISAMETTLDQIQDRLNRAESTTDDALKNLETTLTTLDERLDGVASQVDPDLASRLRSEFEARLEDLMASVRETVDSVRKELAEEVNRTAVAPAEAAIAEVRGTLDEMQTRLQSTEERLDDNAARLAASEERQANAIETVSSQVTALNENFDARLRDVEERSDSAASEAVREEIERLGKTVSDRIDELAEDLNQRLADSEVRSASAIEQIGDQVAAATNRLQLRQNEAIKTLAEQVDENRKKADARLSDALANVSERLDQIQSDSSMSLSPVQKAIASLAARLESLEDATAPASAQEDVPYIPDAGDAEEAAFDAYEDTPFADISLDEFDDLEEPAELDLLDGTLPSDAPAPAEDTKTVEAAVESEAVEDDGVAFEPVEDYAPEEAAETPAEAEAEAAADFEAGIETWDEPERTITDETSFEDDFDMIRAAVEGLSLSQQDPPPAAADEEEDPFEALADDDGFMGDDDLLEADDPLSEVEPESAPPQDAEAELAKLRELDALDALTELDDGHTEARESDIFDDEEFETVELPPALEQQTPQLAKVIDVDTADYLSRARKAALAASTKTAGSLQNRITSKSSAGGASRLPLIAAASAVAVAGLAAGGYLYLRGKQEPPEQATPAGTYVDPGVQETAASATSAEDPSTVDADLFDAETAPPSPAGTRAVRYAPVPVVVTVEAAAASGNYIAQYQLAQDKLSSGDFAGGAALMRKAAMKGLPMAQYALAKLHERGTGVPKDLTLSREWTEKAANGGNVKAMHDLAVFLAEGEGGEQSYAGAVEWFRKGAEYGVVDSQYNLGVLYEQGLGISPNLTESLFWFQVAAKNGDGGAPSKVAELKSRVSPEAASQAAARAEEWTPSPANAIANGRFGAQIWNMGNPLQVQAIQKALNALGFEAGVPDGIMGESTSQAIRGYQQANKLDVTGTVTASLIETLNRGATTE